MPIITDHLNGDSSTGSFSISLFIGNVINLYLYGALTVQLYLYYISFPEDSRLFKATIYIIYLIETVYTILLTYGWGQSLFDGGFLYPIGSITIPICGSLVALLTQCIYAYRVWVISELKIMSCCIVVAIASGVIATVATSIADFYLSGYFEPAVLIWSTISLMTDLAIACILTWSLKKGKISSKRLREKVARLVYLIIGTGFLTVAVNIITIVTAFIPATDPVGPSIVLSKLYANSMMVFVNDRISSRRSHDDHIGASDTVTVHIGSLHFARAPGTVTEAELEEQQASICGVIEIDMSTKMAVEVPTKRSQSEKGDNGVNME